MIRNTYKIVHSVVLEIEGEGADGAGRHYCSLYSNQHLNLIGTVIKVAPAPNIKNMNIG